MLYYCPKCWKSFGEDVDICEACGADMHAYGLESDYVEKLINALGHPEPTTPIRAASILGRLKDKRAVAPLINLAERAGDIFIALAAIEALGHFHMTEVLRFLRKIAEDHPARMVRLAAATQISALERNLHTHTPSANAICVSQYGRQPS